jgi:DNA-binding NarL/FixJ family response regulator
MPRTVDNFVRQDAEVAVDAEVQHHEALHAAGSCFDAHLLADSRVTIVLEAGDVAAGYQLFCRHRPDVVIVDVALGSLEGLSPIQRIHSHDPQARILVLSLHKDPIIVSRAFDAGASGYIVKDAAIEDLPNASRNPAAWPCSAPTK